MTSVEPRAASLSATASERVLRAERIRNTHRASTLQVAIAGLFLANMLVMTFVIDRWEPSAGLGPVPVHRVVVAVDMPADGVRF